MAGVKKLRYIQIGAETTGAKGTEVNADVIWRGLGALEDAREKVFPEENVGYLSGTSRQYEPTVLARLSMDEVEATFEQLPHIFEAAIEKEASSVDGSGTGYIYEYNPPTTAQPEIRTYTVEGGDDNDEEQFTYGFVESFELSGRPNEAVMVSAEWVGREVAAGTKTAGVSLQAVEEILFNRGKLYIDSTAAAVGTTQIANQWVGFDLSYESGNQPVFTGDGQKYFSFDKNTGPEIELQLILENGAAAVAEKAAWRAGTVRKIRLLFEGTTLATSGTAYDSKSLIIDLSGKYSEADPLEDTDGNDTVTLTFIPRYDSVTTHFATLTVVNALTALP